MTRENRPRMPGKPVSGRLPSRLLDSALPGNAVPEPSQAIPDTAGPVFHRATTLEDQPMSNPAWRGSPLVWILAALAAAALIVALWAGYAYAQEAVVVAEDPTVVIIPWASYLEAAKDTIIGVAVAGLAWAMRHLPGHIVAAIKIFRVEQMLERAIDNGINSVAGAAKDKPLKVDVGNEVIAKALQYVIDKAPGTLVDWMGGSRNIREMIIARLDLDPEVSVEAKGGELVSVRPRAR